MRSRLLLVTSLIVAALSAAKAQQAAPADLASVLNALTFRNLGPFRDGAWITTIAVPDAPAHEHLYTIWVGARSGGVWKTTNGGTTWDPVFDRVGVAPIGAIAIAPSDGNIVWVGTGDQANARSSYSGKGVYKTTDGGKTWQSMGLPDSHHIARIVVHPANPNVVLVAAMGHLFSTNEERGVFKTADGGAHWKKVLYTNDHTGAIDLVMDRKTPNVLYAAMYDKQRMPWRLIEGGPDSGIYKSTDAGETWTRLAGGLPTGTIGRIGLDVFQKNPAILYAFVENLNPNPAGRTMGGEIYRSDDAGATWHKKHPNTVNVGGKAPYSFGQIRIDPSNDQHVIVNSDSMPHSEDGGKTWSGLSFPTSGFFNEAFGDFRTMWWDDQDPQRILLGSDGGLQISFDGGRTSDVAPNLRIGEAYAIGVDMDDPYHVYAGFQDHDSWKGPVNGPMGDVSLENWVTVGPGDGMYNVFDPTDSRWEYNTRELGQMGRMDQKTGVRTVIAPSRAPEHRYNWIAPIGISPHDPKIIYAGAEVLYRSKDRGDHWDVISPDLTTNDKSKIGFPSTPYCTISTLAESPVTAGVIWVGTDDGKVQMTRDAGVTWTDLTPALTSAGAPVDRWVSRVAPSPSDAGTAFVSKNGFRNDDFRPYLYRTTDFGRTWTSIAGDLPNAPVNVVLPDSRNAHLLFVGNDIGVFVSIDDDRHWTRLKANLPTVAVHDLQIQPRERDLLLATYGRALWQGHIAPIEGLTDQVLAGAGATLFDITPRARYGFSEQGMNYNMFGDKYVKVPNEPDAVAIFYYLGSAVPAAHLTIKDASGAVVRELDAPATPGLHRVAWPLNGGGGGRGAGRGGGPGAGPVAPGTYQVTLSAGSETLTKPAVVRDRIPGA